MNRTTSRLWASRALQAAPPRCKYSGGRPFKGYYIYQGMKKGKSKAKPENIWNIPNTLTFSRVIITFVILYCIFAGYSLTLVAVLFAIGMFTDFLDGQIARRFKMTTEFGRQFDMIADRFLMLGVTGALIIDFAIQDSLSRDHLLQIFLTLSREIISFPFALVAIVFGKGLPHARFIGKLTTFLQGVTLPAILLSTQYPIFEFSIYLSWITGIVGAISAFYYINDYRMLLESK